MSQPPSQGSYVFDRKDGDQERLIRSSEILREFTTEAFQRAGLRPGDRAIDIGCGPFGALTVLAEVVGSDGEVVGLDASAEALALAGRLLNQQGLTTVTLVHAEVEALTPPDSRLLGPFDVAYMRRFLVHQADAASTLRRVAALMRPGGRIIAHEIPPSTGYPTLTPPVPAIQRVDALVHATVKARGGSYDVAHQFLSICRDAGLRLISQRGFVPSTEPRSLLDTFEGRAGLSSLGHA